MVTVVTTHWVISGSVSFISVCFKSRCKEDPELPTDAVQDYKIDA